MSKRFIIEEDNIKIQGENISATGDEVHHINVLRHKVGDRVYINKHDVEITGITNDTLTGIIKGDMKEKGIPNVNITLVQSYLKSDKMDYVVQKAVELGVKEIIPVLTKNTVVKLDEKDKIKKKERLTKIAKEAVEQCGRTDSVTVSNVKNLSTIDMDKFDAVLICHEACQNSLKETLAKIHNVMNIAIVIGPEGGLDETEVENMLNSNNSYVVSLGERILRAETASICVLSILWYELG